MLLGKQAGEGADSLEKPIIQLVLDEGGATPWLSSSRFPAKYAIYMAKARCTLPVFPQSGIFTALRESCMLLMKKAKEGADSL